MKVFGSRPRCGERPDPKVGMAIRRHKAVPVVELATGVVGAGGHQPAGQGGHSGHAELPGQLSQKGFFDPQAEGAATHDQMFNAILLHPRRADQAVFGETVHGFNHVQLIARRQPLVALFQGIARAGGVELVGLVEQFQRPVHIHIFEIWNAQYCDPQIQGLQKLLLR